MRAPVIHHIDLADGAGSIVLYDWTSLEVKDGRNLMRIDTVGNVVWKASPPDTQDHFTRMQWDGQTLTANSWSCYRVSVNLENGDVTVLAFTK